MPKQRLLSQTFKPASYDAKLDLKDGLLVGSLQITGRKVGRPSQRLTFHQVGLKITEAKIIKLDKAGEQEIQVSRINHHKSFEEVRVHADELLFPGNYILQLGFSGPCKLSLAELKIKMDKLGSEESARQFLPVIDEPGVEATYKISYAE